MKIYSCIKNKYNKKIKIFGLTVYQEVLKNGFKVKYYCFGLYKTKKNQFVKKYYFLGIQSRVKRYIMQEWSYLSNRIINNTVKRVYNVQQRLATAVSYHKKAFLPYKGIFRGKTVVLVAAGPTVKYFEKIPDAIYVGCNRAFLKEDINFDFLFSIDKAGVDRYYDDFFNYHSDRCIKFIGDQNLGEKFQIPESKIPLSNVHRYITDANMGISVNYNLDISTSPLKNCASVSLQAMQFILYTQPKKIYIVGVDCTSATKMYFQGDGFDNVSRGEDCAFLDKINIDCWGQLKSFINTYYPETEIISVNPVGLRGLFTDIYTCNNDIALEKICS